MSGLKSRSAARNAKALRERSTDAEAKLWSRLRNRQLDGFKFVRQQPAGPFVADFACREADLIVELDGGQHATSTTDDARTEKLGHYGYSVKRFWNTDVLTNADGVLLVIKDALAKAARNRRRWSVEESGSRPIEGEPS